MSTARRKFSEQLSEGKFLVVPGVFDGLSARIAAETGFSALYLTGYGVSASLLGKPDAGFLTLKHMSDRVRMICETVETPLIADADTGFGDVAETVREYESAGVAAIQLEDQVFPKRCGHTPGREVVDLDSALDRIKAALDARSDPEFKIIARTDARTGHGLPAAIDRAAAFVEIGADILFVESPESEEELAAIARALPGAKLIANMVDGGRTPFLPPTRLEAMGFAIGIYPVQGLSAAAAGLQSVYSSLAVAEPEKTKCMPFADLNKAVGFEEIWRADAEV